MKNSPPKSGTGKSAIAPERYSPKLVEKLYPATLVIGSRSLVVVVTRHPTSTSKAWQRTGGGAKAVTATPFRPKSNSGSNV